MARFVLRYCGPEDAAPSRDVKALADVPSVTIIDRTTRMLLVEADDQAIREAVITCEHWVLAEDVGSPVRDISDTCPRE
jgi:hypothetical protein